MRLWPRRRIPLKTVIRRGVLTRLYRALGPAYPTVFIVTELAAGFPVAAAGVGLLSLYAPMSKDEFLTVLLWTGVMMGIVWPISAVRAHRRLRPVREWIRGRRGPRESVEAWQTAVSISLDIWPRVWYQQPLLLVSGITAGFVVILDLSLIDAVVVFAAAWLATGYSAVLDYLSTESGMRPVVADISRSLPVDFDFGRAELPLRWKLFAALPLINVITGLVVAGISSPEDELAALGVDVLIASAVAFSISLILTRRVSESLLAPLDDLVEASGRVERGDFDVGLPVTTSDEVGKVARAFNRMVTGLKERERIRETFGTYVDREVAEHILKEGPSLAGEEVEVTIMFVDIRDFTGFAEGSPAQEVVATLNRLFEQVVPVIHEHGGHVDKFIGDGLLAVFGAPERRANHADEALAAAVEISRRIPEEFEGQLEVGIGLNSGRVVAGNVGGGGRLEFSVIGDAVNVAARVEAATRETGDTILVAERTKELLQGDVALEERPGIALKGKREPVALYAPAPAGEGLSALSRSAGRADSGR